MTVQTPAGLRPTRQRTAILAALTKQQRPVTAQELHALLRRKSGPGLATVYRTLQALADAGVVRTFQTPALEVAYKVCAPGHHHHLICTSCGRVEEIPSCEVGPWARTVAKKRGYSVTAHQADIMGLCPDCR